VRVSSFSRASVVAISLFAAIFLATMFQVRESLNESRAQYAGYQALKSLTVIEFNRTIAKYLTTGDASLLNQADKQLSQIIANTEKLNIDTLTTSINVTANQIKSDIETKYRAMGKLSGDPLALIKNNERELATISFDLSKYAMETNVLSREQQATYLLLTNKSTKQIFNLINSREALFLKEQFNQQIIEQTLSELNDTIAQLKAFPALEIFSQLEQDEDDFFADEEDKEDLSLTAIDELISLINRYQKELSRTMEAKQQTTSGLALLAKQVNKLEQIILLGEQTIAQHQTLMNQRLTWVVVALLVFLLLFLATNYWLTRTVVLNPLRKLRDSFVALVSNNRVENITGIAQDTELGEISQSFNQMLNKLADEDKEKASQLNLVSNAMQTMESQAKNILNSSASTSKHLTAVDEIMTALSQVTENVNTLSHQVVENAQATQKAMNDSQFQVSEVLSASEQTNTAAYAGREAISSLTQSVESVGSIVDVISAIADQTNLLALNAAIEAARAGEHGRGFSVVADEVRQLAGKTQESLSQVSHRLEQLNLATQTLEQNIFGIEKASGQQKQIAELLKDNAVNVVQQAITSANVAENTLAQINQQRQHFVHFEQAMQSVNNEVNQSKDLATNISHDVNRQVSDINQTLKPIARVS